MHSDLPCVIRYPNGTECSEVKRAFYGAATPRGVNVRNDFLRKPTDSPEVLDFVLITHGRIVKEAMAAQRELEKRGLRMGILLLEQIKPYDEIARRILPFLPQKPCKVIFLEEEVYAGGMGMLMSDALKEYGVMANKTVEILAVKDDFVIQTQEENIWKSAHVDCSEIIRVALK